MENGLDAKRGLICLVMDAYDELPAGNDKTPYSLGKVIARVKGEKFVRHMQEARMSISSYISDLLVDLFHPLLTEDSDIYPDVRKRCFAEFVQGAVATLNSSK